MLTSQIPSPSHATESTVANQSLFTRYGSSAHTLATGATGASRKTSKTRRKEERKRARGKKGSVYEEEYLVASVARLFGRVNDTHDEVGRLVWGLLRRGMREQALKVGEEMRGLAEGMGKVRGEVWAVQEQAACAGGVVEGVEGQGERRPRGGDGVYWESQQGDVDGQRNKVPEIKVWKGEMFPL